MSSLSAPQPSTRTVRLRIQVPRSGRNDWVTTDRVGISGDQPLESGKQLSILIEKDFQCLHGDERGIPTPIPIRSKRPCRN